MLFKISLLTFNKILCGTQPCTATSVAWNSFRSSTCKHRFIEGAASVRSAVCANALRGLRTLSAKRGREEKDKAEGDATSDAEGTEPLSNSKRKNIKDLLENSAEFDDQPQSTDDVWTTPVYPVNVDTRRDQAKHSVRPKVDPRQTSVILFPGQGSQFVGMGRNVLSFPNVKEMFDIAGEILKYDLLDLCLNGPKEKLDKTVYCQPAVMVTSLAAVEKLKDEKPWVVENCAATAGFSLGEITALVFAGALHFEDALRVVKIRAEAMQVASEMAPSGMMTVFLRPDAKVNFACNAAREWCYRKGIEDAVCSVANYLFPGCKVIAGNKEALEFIELNAADFGIKKLKHLPVSGAFHTQLMKPAKEPLLQALKMVEIKDPLISVHSNVDGKRYASNEKIVKQLSDQVCQPVRWEQTLHVIYERSHGTTFPSSFECGPGTSLRTLLKMVNAKAWDSSSSIEV